MSGKDLKQGFKFARQASGLTSAMEHYYIQNSMGTAVSIDRLIRNAKVRARMLTTRLDKHEEWVEANAILQALEKEKPIEPVGNLCPRCGILVDGKYCSNCGQRIDWGGKNV